MRRFINSHSAPNIIKVIFGVFTAVNVNAIVGLNVIPCSLVDRFIPCVSVMCAMAEVISTHYQLPLFCLSEYRLITLKTKEVTVNIT
jgi:hypothetical protein